MPSEGEALLEHTFSATTELAEGDHSATEIELHANANQDVRLQQPNEKSCGTIFRQRAGKLFSPPFMAILVAAIMANVSFCAISKLVLGLNTLSDKEKSFFYSWYNRNRCLCFPHYFCHKTLFSLL